MQYTTLIIGAAALVPVALALPAPIGVPANSGAVSPINNAGLSEATINSTLVSFHKAYNGLEVRDDDPVIPECYGYCTSDSDDTDGDDSDAPSDKFYADEHPNGVVNHAKLSEAAINSTLVSFHKAYNGLEVRQDNDTATAECPNCTSDSDDIDGDDSDNPDDANYPDEKGNGAANATEVTKSAGSSEVKSQNDDGETTDDDSLLSEGTELKVTITTIELEDDTDRDTDLVVKRQNDSDSDEDSKVKKQDSGDEQTKDTDPSTPSNPVIRATWEAAHPVDTSATAEASSNNLRKIMREVTRRAKLAISPTFNGDPTGSAPSASGGAWMAGKGEDGRHSSSSSSESD